MTREIKIGQVSFGGGSELALIAGPCVLESASLAYETAGVLKDITARLGLGLVFKASFDKANRTSPASFRGPGFDQGLAIMAEVKDRHGLPVISDIHESWQAEAAAKVLDALQIPAFLARQTDLLIAAARTGLPIHLKKGQFMAPEDMAQAAAKMENQPGFSGLLLCERGSCFGYHNLVVDMRGLAIMADSGWPVVFDASHSVQRPSSVGGSSGGDRRFVPTLARAAVAAGIDGLFLETHPDPDRALCDGPNQWPLDRLEELLADLKAIHSLKPQKFF